eukprot:8577398-Lingulodinium_polyedra.AAC.1
MTPRNYWSSRCSCEKTEKAIACARARARSRGSSSGGSAASPALWVAAPPGDPCAAAPVM